MIVSIVAATGSDFPPLEVSTPAISELPCAPQAGSPGTFADEAEAAIEYLDRGYAPIPLDGPRTKTVTRPNWPAERYTSADASKFFGRNIGLLAGTPSGGLADADCDCPEAIRAAAVLLPRTGMVSGRAGAPRSHLFFRCDPLPRSTSYSDPEGKGAHLKGMIVELRTGRNAAGDKGEQTVVPPSTHPSGETVVWHQFDEPARIAAAELEASVGAVAAAAPLARHWPKGRRHDAAMALSGGLLRLPAWDIPRVERFVRAVCAAAEDEEVQDRTACVRDTAGKLQDAKQATGWDRLSESVGGQIVAKVREWLGIHDRGPRTGPSVDVGQWVPFPTRALPPVPRVYVEAAAAAFGCDPAYAALPLLAVLGGAIGTTCRVRLKNDWLEPPAVWAAAIGLSGATKSPPHRDIEEMTQDVNDRLAESNLQAAASHATLIEEREALLETGVEVGPEPAPPAERTFTVADITIEALTVVLGQNPRGVTVVRDELAGWIGGFARYGTKAGASEVPNWLQLFSAGTIDYRRKTGEPKTVRVRGVAVSVCGTTQPDIIARAMTPELRAAGLFARLLVTYPPLRQRVWSEHVIPSEARRAVVELLGRGGDARLVLVRPGQPRHRRRGGGRGPRLGVGRSRRTARGRMPATRVSSGRRVRAGCHNRRFASCRQCRRYRPPRTDQPRGVRTITQSIDVITELVLKNLRGFMPSTSMRIKAPVVFPSSVPTRWEARICLPSGEGTAVS